MARLILIGPPGAGKGTQGKRLASELHIPIIVMGDLLREKRNENSALGAEIKSLMSEGKYVPDEVVIEIIQERITQEDCRDGFVLDGFPRTVGQADALDQLLEDLGLTLDAVVHLEVDHEELLRRITGRRICPTCKREYHVEFKPPQKDLVCDEDGSQLIQREDDQEATFRKRLEVYEQHTTPLVDYYKRKGVLRTVDGNGSFDEVFRRIHEVVGA